MTTKIKLKGETTVEAAVKQCKELQKTTGKDWYFKANEGTIMLVCDECE